MKKGFRLHYGRTARLIECKEMEIAMVCFAQQCRAWRTLFGRLAIGRHPRLQVPCQTGRLQHMNLDIKGRLIDAIRWVDPDLRLENKLHRLFQLNHRCLATLPRIRDLKARLA
jgi:hypothetical protein